MPSQRTLSWSSALRDLKADHASRPAIREERLRSTPHVTLSAWRGRSGRRYVVSVHPVTAEDHGPAVVIAVARDAAGIASIVTLGEATELHVHRLAETDEARAAVAADLR